MGATAERVAQLTEKTQNEGRERDAKQAVMFARRRAQEDAAAKEANAAKTLSDWQKKAERYSNELWEAQDLLSDLQKKAESYYNQFQAAEHLYLDLQKKAATLQEKADDHAHALLRSEQRVAQLIKKNIDSNLSFGLLGILSILLFVAVISMMVNA